MPVSTEPAEQFLSKDPIQIKFGHYCKIEGALISN